jgi:hypothetical protein
MVHRIAERCRRDPPRVRLGVFGGREAEGVLLVPKAGEMLYRLRG